MQEAKSELQNNTNTKYEIKEIVNWEELPTDVMILRGIYSYLF